MSRIETKSQLILFVLELTYYQKHQDINFYRDYIGNLVYSLRITFNTLPTLLNSGDILPSSTPSTSEKNINISSGLRIGILSIRSNTLELDYRLKYFDLVDLHKCLDSILESCSNYEDLIKPSNDEEDEIEEDDMTFMSFSQYLKFLQSVNFERTIVNCIYISGNSKLKVSKKTGECIDFLLYRNIHVTFLRITNPLKKNKPKNNLELDDFGLHLPPRCCVLFSENELVDTKRNILVALLPTLKEYNFTKSRTASASDSDLPLEIKLVFSDGKYGSAYCSVDYQVPKSMDICEEAICKCHLQPLHPSKSMRTQKRCFYDGITLRNDQVCSILKIHEYPVKILFSSSFKDISTTTTTTTTTNNNNNIIELNKLKRVPISTISESIFYGTTGILSPSKIIFEGSRSGSLTRTEEFDNSHVFAALSNYLNKKDLGLLFYYISKQTKIDQFMSSINNSRRIISSDDDENDVLLLYKFVMLFGDVGGSRMFMKHVIDGDMLIPISKSISSVDLEISSKVENLMDGIDCSAFSPLQVSSGYHECVNKLIANSQVPELEKFLNNEEEFFRNEGNTNFTSSSSISSTSNNNNRRRKKKKKIRFRSLN